MISLVELYALTLIPGVGDQTLRKIVTRGISVQDLISNEKQTRINILNEDSYKVLSEDFDNLRAKAEQQISELRDNQIEVIYCLDAKYPAYLALLRDFPIFLYCKGNLELLLHENNVAVIGTRDNSDVGARITKATTSACVQRDFTIVSGLAKGIDGIAHQAALDSKGYTIAVLIDVHKIYPKENQKLAESIIVDKGLLISENKPGSYQGKNAFVLRDRIQSGLSLAIFPIETDVRGGTMHTVGYAKKQSRLAFVPNVYHHSIQSNYLQAVGPKFSKIEGIKHLIDNRSAIPYIKEDYPSVFSKLNEIKIYLKELVREVEWLPRNVANSQKSTNHKYVQTEKLKDNQHLQSKTLNDPDGVFLFEPKHNVSAKPPKQEFIKNEAKEIELTNSELPLEQARNPSVSSKRMYLATKEKELETQIKELQQALKKAKRELKEAVKELAKFEAEFESTSEKQIRSKSTINGTLPLY